MLIQESSSFPAERSSSTRNPGCNEIDFVEVATDSAEAAPGSSPCAELISATTISRCSGYMLQITDNTGWIAWVRLKSVIR